MLVVRVTGEERDSLDLRYAVHYAGAGVPARFVVFLNGRTEWIEKYLYLARDLGLPDDTAFLTMDHRGQGASGGARSYVEDYDDFAKDVAKVLAEAVGDKPYAVLSHSMGGLIALYATLTGRIAPRALVLSSPLLGLPDRPVPRPLAKPLAKALSAAFLGAVSSGGGKFTETPFEQNRLTHAVELYKRMQKTPYPCPGATFGWVAASFRAIDVCFDPRRLAGLTVPTLVLGGTDESVVDRAAFQRWVKAASEHAKADVQLRVIPGARHELFSEIPSYYDQALAAARDWLLPRLG
jgi:lysophospholipase